MWDRQSVFTDDGTYNIHTLIIAERMTGIAAYK